MNGALCIPMVVHRIDFLFCIPILVKEIFSIIKEINAQGTTVLLVEQNAKMALSIAHRAYVLETGKIVLSGTGEELINSPEIQKAYLGG